MGCLWAPLEHYCFPDFFKYNLPIWAKDHVRQEAFGDKAWTVFFYCDPLESFWGGPLALPRVWTLESWCHCCRFCSACLITKTTHAISMGCDCQNHSWPWALFQILEGFVMSSWGVIFLTLTLLMEKSITWQELVPELWIGCSGTSRRRCHLKKIPKGSLV